LGYFPRGTYNKEFEDIAFKLPDSVVSDPFKTPDGWHIVEVLDHVDSGSAIDDPTVFKEAERQYANGLAGVRSRVFIDSLTAAAKYNFNEEALNSDIQTVPPETWAAIINDRDTINFYRMPDYLFQFKQANGLEELTLNDKFQSLILRSQKYLVMEAGDDLGFDKDSIVIAQRKALYHKYAIDYVLKDRRPERYTPPDSLVEDYYEHHKSEYVVERPIYVQHIITQDSLFAEYLRDQALSGIDFMTLAEENYPGAEEIRRAAADLGYIGEKDMPQAFWYAAISTPIDGISRPVKTEYGYHIIKVVDKKFSRSLEQVRTEIEKKLRREYNEQFVKDWDKDKIASHDVVYNLKPIKRIELDPKNRR
jgi:parvulin-like peptidyl-prolyl isomerase